MQELVAVLMKAIAAKRLSRAEMLMLIVQIIRNLKKQHEHPADCTGICYGMYPKMRDKDECEDDTHRSLDEC